MKKFLLIAAVATMAAAANAQLRSDIVANDNETQQAVLVAPRLVRSIHLFIPAMTRMARGVTTARGYT